MKRIRNQVSKEKKKRALKKDFPPLKDSSFFTLLRFYHKLTENSTFVKNQGKRTFRVFRIAPDSDSVIDLTLGYRKNAKNKPPYYLFDGSNKKYISSLFKVLDNTFLIEQDFHFAIVRFSPSVENPESIKIQYWHKDHPRKYISKKDFIGMKVEILKEALQGGGGE